jgi:hypothetical protein
MREGIWLRRPQWPVIAPAVADPLDRQLAVRESVTTRRHMRPV